MKDKGTASNSFFAAAAKADPVKKVLPPPPPAAASAPPSPASEAELFAFGRQFRQQADDPEPTEVSDHGVFASYSRRTDDVDPKEPEAVISPSAPHEEELRGAGEVDWPQHGDCHVPDMKPAVAGEGAAQLPAQAEADIVTSGEGVDTPTADPVERFAIDSAGMTDVSAAPHPKAAEDTSAHPASPEELRKAAVLAGELLRTMMALQANHERKVPEVQSDNSAAMESSVAEVSHPEELAASAEQPAVPPGSKKAATHPILKSDLDIHSLLDRLLDEESSVTNELPAPSVEAAPAVPRNTVRKQPPLTRLTGKPLDAPSKAEAVDLLKGLFSRLKEDDTLHGAHRDAEFSAGSEHCASSISSDAGDHDAAVEVLASDPPGAYEDDRLGSREGDASASEDVDVDPGRTDSLLTDSPAFDADDQASEAKDAPALQPSDTDLIELVDLDDQEGANVIRVDDASTSQVVGAGTAELTDAQQTAIGLSNEDLPPSDETVSEATEVVTLPPVAAAPDVGDLPHGSVRNDVVPAIPEHAMASDDEVPAVPPDALTLPRQSEPALPPIWQRFDATLKDLGLLQPTRR